MNSFGPPPQNFDPYSRPPGPFVHVPNPHPESPRISYRKMGWIAGTFHGVMMVLTMGLWTPVFLLARRGRKTVHRY